MKQSQRGAEGGFEGGLAAVLGEHIAERSVRPLERGETLFAAGEPIVAVYGILEGRLIVRGGDEQDAPVLFLAEQGQALAVAEAVRGAATHSVSAVALTRSVVDAIAIDRFRSALASDIGLQVAVMRSLCERTGHLEQRAIEIAQWPARDRIIRMLLALAGNGGTGGATLPFDDGSVGATDLADLANCGRSTVYRVLEQLRDEGVITLRGGSVSFGSRADIRSRLSTAERRLHFGSADA